MRCALYVRRANFRHSQTPQIQSIPTNSFPSDPLQSYLSDSSPAQTNNSTSVAIATSQSKMGRQTRNTQLTEPSTKQGQPVQTRQTRSSQQSSASTVTTRSGSNSLTTKTSLNPARSEVTTHHRSSGGRHLQPPVGNDAKLKHKCPFDGCPWRFATPYKLRRHIKSHTKETPYQCKECGRGFSVRYNLLMHIQTIHSTPQKYRCPISECKEAFHTQPRLNGHLRKVHKTDLKELQSEQKEDAGVSSSSSATTSQAQPSDATSQTSFTCRDCKRSFSSQAKLSAHMRTHTTSRPFKCKVEGCQKSFQTADKLTKHTETHKTEKGFPCPHENCNRLFLRQSHLKNHMKVHYRDQYVCPLSGCGEKFSSEPDFNDHVNLHMGYSLPCPQCSLVFPTPKRLELHCHVAHGSDYVTGSPSQPLPLLTPTTPTTPLSVASPFSQPEDQKFSCTIVPHMVNNEVVLNNVMGHRTMLPKLDLPDLRVEEVEAIISHNPEKLNQCNSNSLNDSESDSGYSTFDVSPNGSTTSSTHLLNPLSPAITPITPLPMLPTTTSPISFTYTEDTLSGIAGPSAFLPPPPLSGNSTYDTSFFFNPNELHGMPSTPIDTLSEHSFPPSTPYQQSELAASPHFSMADPTIQTLPMQPLEIVSIPTSYHDGVQSVQPATSNLSSLEDSKHNVVIVPNSYSCFQPQPLSSFGNLPTSVAVSYSTPTTLMYPELYKPSVALLTTPPPSRVDESIVINIKSEPSHHGCLHMSPEHATQSVPTTSHTLPLFSTGDINNVVTSFLPPFSASYHAPPPTYVVSNSNTSNEILDKFSKPTEKISAKTNNSNDTSCSVMTTLHSASKPNTCNVEVVSLPSDGGPTVYAQVLPTSSVAPVNYSKSNGQLAAGSSKLRYRSNSTPMKPIQHKKPQWPKSMNPGNLMAFRNFILKKLNKGPGEIDYASEMTTSTISDYHKSLGMPQECFSESSMPFYLNSSKSESTLPDCSNIDDIFKDINFNPDSLLTSETSQDGGSLSPFSSPSCKSPSPGPFSPAMMDPSLKPTRKDSVFSDSVLEDNNMDFDGFFQFFNVNPISQTASNPEVILPLSRDLDNIFKTDADPLLGGLS